MICSGCSTPRRDPEQDHPGVCVCGGFLTDPPGQFDELNKITHDEIDRENHRLLKRLVEIVPAPQVKS